MDHKTNPPIDPHPRRYRKILRLTLGFSMAIHAAVLIQQNTPRPLILSSSAESMPTGFDVELKEVPPRPNKKDPPPKLAQKKPRPVEPTKEEKTPTPPEKAKPQKEFSLPSMAPAITKSFEENIQDSPAPNYPMMARRRGQEGFVTVKIEVEKNGHPVDVIVLESSGHQLLDRAALSAVKRWRFRPVAQLAHSYFVEKTIEFRLQ